MKSRLPIVLLAAFSTLSPALATGDLPTTPAPVAIVETKPVSVTTAVPCDTALTGDCAAGDVNDTAVSAPLEMPSATKPMPLESEG